MRRGRISSPSLWAEKSEMNIDWNYPNNRIYPISWESLSDYWKECIDQGYWIEATWLEGEDTPLKRLYEAGAARVLIFYYEGCEPPDHRLAEIGAALANGRAVIFAGDAVYHELAEHVHATRMTLPDALLHAQNLINDEAGERVAYIQTYAHIEYRRDTRPAHPPEADIIAISSHADTKDNAIILPYPNGHSWARKICNHIDDAMARSYQLATKGVEA
jgi:hypothetical protein